MGQTTLFIFSGLPGCGKSTLAKELAKKTRATFIRIDTIEQGLLNICNYQVQGGEGYEMSHLVARDNLRLGIDVVADSVNPWDLTRKHWNEVAISSGAKFKNIEIVCSDLKEHRLRVEGRRVDVENLKLPTWEETVNRDYHKWNEDRIVIDTAKKQISDSVDELMNKLGL